MCAIWDAFCEGYPQERQTIDNDLGLRLLNYWYGLGVLAGINGVNMARQWPELHKIFRGRLTRYDKAMREQYFQGLRDGIRLRHEATP